MLASVIITTYNRREALVATLRALGHQTVAPGDYEVIVVDDGSTDGTYEAVNAMSLRCAVKCLRHPENRGISAGRNLAIRNATGRYLILVSDDLLVPEDFIASHVETLERFPGWWVVGGFKQLESLRETAFGRYLDQMEKRYESMRLSAAIGDGLWEMTWPTARNLSLPRADLDRTGLFDEQFRHSCEDQDLTHRARERGIRFLYNSSIECLHNDQVADLKRCCEQQRRFALQTVAFCDKYPSIHGDSELARVNGFISGRDSAPLAVKKLIKGLLATRIATGLVEVAIRTFEGLRLPDAALFPMYRMVIGVYIFRGWREGLRRRPRGLALDVQSLSYHPDL